MKQRGCCIGMNAEVTELAAMDHAKLQPAPVAAG
jgi:hypothetical protein